MELFLLIVAGIVLSYAIPVTVSLVFTMLVGRAAPRFLAGNGRINARFVFSHGLVWALASAAAGFTVAAIVPQFKAATCLVGAAILIIVLIANTTEMKKQQGALQIGGIIAATVLGFAVGLEVFLMMLKRSEL